MKTKIWGTIKITRACIEEMEFAYFNDDKKKMVIDSKILKYMEDNRNWFVPISLRKITIVKLDFTDEIRPRSVLDIFTIADLLGLNHLKLDELVNLRCKYTHQPKDEIALFGHEEIPIVIGEYLTLTHGMTHEIQPSNFEAGKFVTKSGYHRAIDYLRDTDIKSIDTAFFKL